MAGEEKMTEMAEHQDEIDSMDELFDIKAGNGLCNCFAATYSVIGCLDKIICYSQRIFNRNRKLKQQVSK